MSTSNRKQFSDCGSCQRYHSPGTVGFSGSSWAATTTLHGSISQIHVYSQLLVVLSTLVVLVAARDVWWNLAGHIGSPAELSVLGSTRPVCAALPPSLVTLTAAQSKLCSLYPDHMDAVTRGARLGLDECRWQFRNHRWNCSSVFDGLVSTTTAAVAAEVNGDEQPVQQQQQGQLLVGAANDSRRLLANGHVALAELLAPSINIGTAEAGFRHAILSAGVLYSVSRACRDGELSACGCSSRARPDDLEEDWVWGGCGDNTAYGYKFSVVFVDAREREKNYPRHSKQLARMLMNLHNNEAGRRAAYSYTRASCKCHGVSGSCSLRTCWNQLPEFRETGDRLRARYERAREVTFNGHGTSLQPKPPSKKSAAKNHHHQQQQPQQQPRGRPTREDLVYVDRSPDYCEADRDGGGPTTGATGTRGRRCQRASRGPDGCGLMCCGRGYDTFRTRVEERCQCRFQWCCTVVCKTCRRVENVHTCK